MVDPWRQTLHYSAISCPAKTDKGNLKRLKFHSQVIIDFIHNFVPNNKAIYFIAHFQVSTLNKYFFVGAFFLSPKYMMKPHVF